MTHTYTTFIREYVPPPLAAPSPSPAICPCCGFDRYRAIDDGMDIAALPAYMRTPLQNTRVAILINMLNLCERGCNAAGGWRETQ